MSVSLAMHESPEKRNKNAGVLRMTVDAIGAVSDQIDLAPMSP
jgi:hypothetical protein